MQVYVHSEGNEDPELVEIEATTLVRELIVVEGLDHQIWIDEREEPVELDISLGEAGIRHRDHVHRGRCREVEVEVRFNGERLPHDFRQMTTIRRVLEWAVGEHGFDLTPEQQAKHVLALPGADHFLDSSVHLGSLVTQGSCDVLLDLLPRERFEG